MIIGVFGSAAGISTGLEQQAILLGQFIAEAGATLITGACQGLPYAAIKGAKKYNGGTIGCTAVTHEKLHESIMGTSVSYYDQLIYIPNDFTHKQIHQVCLKYRNVVAVSHCDAAVFISGRWGTLNEFTIAYDIGKPIGVLTGSGGMTEFLPSLLEAFQKPSESRLYFNEQPKLLIQQLIEDHQMNKQKINH
ncbi:SLOG cluster 4 domain-containing protein [Spartinivicinus ruber]|uniref:SLOG cluster 4 domain-containing protein n=1 Tax=Spartinivicinus ruber TaxID=2683272 RepID=UPI0013D25BC4|nr:hypothetical protein [Spartinivicinus ruber]